MAKELFCDVVTHKAKTRKSIVAIFGSLPILAVAMVVIWSLFQYTIPAVQGAHFDKKWIDIVLPKPPQGIRPKTATPPKNTGDGPTIPLEPPEKINPEVSRVPPTVDERPGPGEIPGGDFGDVTTTRVEVPPPPPPPPPAKPQEPLRPGGDIKFPVRTRNVNPVYSSIAQSARVQGIVIIEAVIGIDGRVKDARILRSIPLLDASALDAVRQWEYTPTMLNGKPVPVVISITVNFTLQ